MSTKVSKKQTAATDKMEWIIAVFGMALISVALGVILYRAVTQETKPVNLSVSVENIQQTEQGYRVDFHVDNKGSETAAAVVIEGELSEGGQSVEKSNSTLAYAPANSRRRGGIYFTNDPSLYEMTLRAAGFERP